MTSTCYDTLRIETNGCPPGCSECHVGNKERGGTYEGCTNIKVVHLPEIGLDTAIVCNQCSDPACAVVCPTGAIGKDPADGIVRIDDSKCLGCGLCNLSCSYGGIQYDAKKMKSSKCDLCDGEPRCVAGCPEGNVQSMSARAVLAGMSDDPFERGTSACGGCPGELSLRTVMKTLGNDSLLFGAPGCISLLIAGNGTKTLYHGGSHLSNMTNLPSTAAGVQRLYRKRGHDVRCVCFAGDGCFADVGFQPLSGAAERGENLIVVCYDNQGYMNTGIQRSGTTPYMGWTTTTPVGKKQKGKQKPAKDLPLIMAAHDIPYVATATVGYLEDFVQKLRKAATVTDGMAYIHVLSPCHPGWRSRPDLAIEISRLAVESNYFPLWEFERGRYRLTHVVKKPKPVRAFLKHTGRFAHLEEEDIDEFQQMVNRRFAVIQAHTEMDTLE